MLAATRRVVHFIGGKLREYQHQASYKVSFILCVKHQNQWIEVSGKTLTFPARDPQNLVDSVESIVAGMSVIAAFYATARSDAMISVAVSHPDPALQWSETYCIPLP